MSRDPSRLFAVAAVALLGVVAVLAGRVLFPSWKGVQEDRLEQQIRVAKTALTIEQQAFQDASRSLGYRRAIAAAEQAEVVLNAPSTVSRLSEIGVRIEELESRRADRQLELSRVATSQGPAQDELRHEYVRLTGTPGVPDDRIEELEGRLSFGDLRTALLEEELDALDRELTALAREDEQLRAASEEAVRRLAVFRVDLDRAEAHLTRLRQWRRGIHETTTPVGNAERCLTCHPGMDDLASTHSALGHDSPFQGWGCTICHGGNGRALTVEAAHRHQTLRPWTFGEDYTLQPAIDLLSSPDKEERASAAAFLRRLTGREFGFSYHGTEEERREAIVRWSNWWSANRAFWLPPRPRALAAFGHDASGRPEDYIGSGVCLRCHESRQRRHVARWRSTKFRSFARTEEVEDPTPCLPCHTTGYDARTATYVQPGVTCEGCHGPGSGYSTAMEAGVILQSRGELDEGEQLLDEVSTRMRDQMSAQNVCVDCHDPFGVKELDYEHLM